MTSRRPALALWCTVWTRPGNPPPQYAAQSTSSLPRRLRTSTCLYSTPLPPLLFRKESSLPYVVPSPWRGGHIAVLRCFLFHKSSWLLIRKPSPQKSTRTRDPTPGPKLEASRQFERQFLNKSLVHDQDILCLSVINHFHPVLMPYLVPKIFSPYSLYRIFEHMHWALNIFEKNN